MVVALKKDGKITVGITVCDDFVDMSVTDLALEENLPFWKVKGTKDCYVFSEDLTFAADLLRYHDFIFKDITDGNSIVTNVVPKMKELLDGYNLITKSKEWDSQLLIVKGDKMYTIGHYFSVSEIDEATGLGFEPYLLGGLDESKDLPPVESILFAVRNLNRMRCRNLFPLTVMDLQTKKRTVYYQ